MAMERIYVTTPQIVLKGAHQGENLARCVCFPIDGLKEQYGEGTWTIVFRRPFESDPYVVANQEEVGDYAVWGMDATDTAVAGEGRVELRYYVDDTLCKTDVYAVLILPSLGETGDAPSPYEDIIDTVAGYVNEAKEAVATVPETVAEMQAQLDEAISGVTVDSEVINARVDADGTTYSTLKQRLDAENTELKNQISQDEKDIAILKTLHDKADLTFEEISRIVTSGRASEWFQIGDQIMLNYNDGTRELVLPWDVVHFGDVTLQDESVVPGMFIQSHYAMQPVMFDQNEAFYVVPSGGLSAGTYNIEMGNSWASYVVAGKSYYWTLTESYAEGDLLQFGKAGDEIGGLPDQAETNWRVRTYKAANGVSAGMAVSPTEVLTVTEGTEGTNLGVLSSSTKYADSGVNNMQRASYGYNRWSQSAMRQFLNSDAAVGEWWTPQNVFDRRPTQLASIRGFMAGFDADFLAIIKPVKVTTALNTVSDSLIGTSEDTFDTFFPASLEQEYIVPQLSGVEGDYWEYWKERLGLDRPQGTGNSNANENHIRYAYESQTSAQSCRLRSAHRGLASYTWNVSSTGYASNNGATASVRCAPACVIC